MPTVEQYLLLIKLATTAIFAVLTIVLTVATPFIPDEIFTAIIALIAGYFTFKQAKKNKKTA